MPPPEPVSSKRDWRRKPATSPQLSEGKRAPEVRSHRSAPGAIADGRAVGHPRTAPAAVSIVEALGIVVVGGGNPVEAGVTVGRSICQAGVEEHRAGPTITR